MKAEAVSLLVLFEKRMRLEVPIFQRKYVWNSEHHWEPLWEDIQRKFIEYLDGNKDAPVHFLGALVLDQKQTPATHVEKRQVIDGQQRLTTLQIFLAAFRDFCREQSCEDLAREFDGYTVNKGMMADRDVDKYKVWPSRADRDQFTDVIGLGSRADIEAKHPLVKQKYARKWDPRPPMVEAYLYFGDVIREFFLGADGEPPHAEIQPIEERIEECFLALKSALKVVVIDLEQGDDAQVIFETLNARGEPLLPADLLRNYIFLRAARCGESPEDLHEKYWEGFDDPFWSVEVRQGRLIRPRSDLFMQHFLASRQMRDIPIKHLFVEYSGWIKNDRPFPTVAAELATLSKQREEFRRILDPRKGDAVHGLANFLNEFDISTAYPLLMYLFDVGLKDAAWKAVSTTLESYFVRRALMGWTTKSYNRTFLDITKKMKDIGPTPDTLNTVLSRLQGESAEWPTDKAFRNAWLTSPAYEVLNNAKLVHVLWRLNEKYLTSRHEPITLDGPLSVEHIMPQTWGEHWRLPGGGKAMTAEEFDVVDADDPKALAMQHRNNALQTIGNLTILTQELNSSASNSAWRKKKTLLKSSLLPINHILDGYDEWDESAIQERGKELFQKALKIWPKPPS